jgi:hypothetical protein
VPFLDCVLDLAFLTIVEAPRAIELINELVEAKHSAAATVDGVLEPDFRDGSRPSIVRLMSC